MIYRWDDLCESQDFEHDQKFVKAEHWREACDELEDKVKTIAFKDQEITRLKKALEVANTAFENIDTLVSDRQFGNIEGEIQEAQKQIKEVLEEGK